MAPYRRFAFGFLRAGLIVEGVAVGMALVIAVASGVALAWVQPASLFQSGMVLQSGMQAPIWGTAEPGERVKVYFGGQMKVAVAGKDSRWMVKLDPLPVSARPARLSMIGQDTTTLTDVLVGEVWLASGQSNMQYTFRADLYPDEARKADRPLLRSFNVAGTPGPDPADSVQGSWITCTPDTIGQFSAVGYFFAAKLQDELKVPIGIINASWGGTPIEAWTSLAALQANPRLKGPAQAQVAAMLSRPQDEARFDSANQAWEERYGYTDTGNKGYELGWADPDFDASRWTTVKAPCGFPAMGLNGGGVVWLRKDVTVPADREGQGFSIDLGSATDAFDCYWNGTPVGQSAKAHYSHSRWIWIDGANVSEGRNVLAVRLVSHTSADGIWNPDATLGLPPALSSEPTDTWRAMVEARFPRLTAAAAKEMPTSFPTADPVLTPGYLFDGLISPLIPFALRGAVWYQGENNTDERAPLYRTMLTTLIDDWRTRWGEGAFPFYITQLANFNASAGWPVVRDAQLQVSRTVPNTGLAVTIDIGDASNVHPADKLDVGNRLALNALAKDYGREVEWSGPLLESVTPEGAAIRARFSHAVGGLVICGSQGSALKDFEVAGANGRFYAATAVIDGDAVVASSPRVPAPVRVRYAWAANPPGANLYNAAGLPAPPFTSEAATP